MNPSPESEAAVTGTGTAGAAAEAAENLRLAPTPVCWLYLLLAVAGAVLPWQANLEFIRLHGSSFDLGLFVSMANANAAAQSLSRDLAVGATAVTVWMVVESRRLRMKGLVWVLLSCVTVAFACGAPLFLYLRERRLAEIAGRGV